MDKLKLHTPDLTAMNIDRIAALFPNCVTEAKDEKGNLKRAIDFDLLRQELSPDLVEGPQERYRLDWPGKREALALANTPVALTLRPCREESVDFENTQNLYIEGDNLDALKLLQETYLGKVKMIYIDPPYNTGNDFIYDDNFSMGRGEYDELSGERDREGNVTFDAEKWKQNSSANGRFHSEWLSMIYPRMKTARNLLTEDGVIFVSIDDHEVVNLIKVCEEIMGPNSLLGLVCNRRRQVPDNRNHNRVSTDHEYIAIVSMPGFRMLGTPKDLSKYTNPDNDPRGPWMSDNMTGLASRDDRPNLHYNIVDPDTGKCYPPHPSRGWAYEKKRMDLLIEEQRVLWPKNPDGRPRIKRFVRELSEDVTGFSTVQSLGYTTDGTRELTDLLEAKLFDFPKPVSLLRKLLEQATDRNSIILDFFSGSATTAHAAMQLNAEDGGNRRHIMVQLPEPCGDSSEASKAGYRTIAEIGKERIRRAGKKILEEWQAKQAKENSTQGDLLHPPSTISDSPSLPDIGFRVLKIADSNFRDIERTPDDLAQQELALHTEHIKPDRTPEDLLFQVLVDWGVDLALPINSETLHGKHVFFVDQNALAACFDTGLTDDLIKTIAARKPLRAVFRDDGFGDDSTRINVEQIFKLLSPATEVKSL
jgi:adenine-specific DNA-methyltransferase